MNTTNLRCKTIFLKPTKNIIMFTNNFEWNKHDRLFWLEDRIYYTWIDF